MGFWSDLWDQAVNLVDGVKEAFVEFGREIADATRELFSSTSKVSAEIGETPVYKQEKATVAQVMSVNEILSKYTRNAERQADAVEGNFIKAVQVYFDEYSQTISRIFPDFKIQQLQWNSKKIITDIKGSVKEHIAKTLSTDNQECLNLLRMEQGSNKKNKMNEFTNRTIKEAISILDRKVNKAVLAQNRQIEEYVYDMLDEEKKSLDEQYKNYNTLLANSGDVLQKEKMQSGPIITNFAAELIKTLLSA